MVQATSIHAYEHRAFNCQYYNHSPYNPALDLFFTTTFFERIGNGLNYYFPFSTCHLPFTVAPASTINIAASHTRMQTKQIGFALFAIVSIGNWTFIFFSFCIRAIHWNSKSNRLTKTTKAKKKSFEIRMDSERFTWNYRNKHFYFNEHCIK